MLEWNLEAQELGLANMSGTWNLRSHVNRPLECGDVVRRIIVSYTSVLSQSTFKTPVVVGEIHTKSNTSYG